MISAEVQQAVLAEISTSRVLALAAGLQAMDRMPGGSGLQQAQRQVVAALAEVRGLELADLDYPRGPDRRYFGWTDPRRAFVERAELWLQSPDGGEILLCRRSDNFASSMGAFRSTPEEGEVFELVDVGFGARAGDYRGQRVAGKVALASGHYFEAAMLEALAGRKAEGLLCGPGGRLSDPTRVEANQLEDPELFGTHRPFGFNLSARQYRRLANLLGAGETVRVRVVLRLTSDLGAMPGLLARLVGSDLRQERVTLLALLSGEDGPLAVASLVQVMRVLAALNVRGVTQGLRRSLELLVLPDLRSVVAWLDGEVGRGDPSRAVLQLSLPSPAAAASLSLARPLPTLPTFLGDLLQDHLSWAAQVEGSFRTELPLSVRSGPSRAGCPTLPLSDRDLRVPSVWVSGRETRRPRTPGRAPHGPLHRLGAALACAALDLGTLGQQDLPRLLCGSHLAAQGRQLRRAARLRAGLGADLQQARDPREAARRRLWHAEASLGEGLRREQETLASCAGFLGGAGRHALRLAEEQQSLEQGTQGLLTSLRGELEGLLDGQSAPPRRKESALERRASTVVAHRDYRGPLPTPYLLREATEPHRAWLALNRHALAEQPVGEQLTQWVDNRRTLLEIFDLVRLDHPGADLKLLWRYLQALESAGCVRMVEQTGIQEA